MDENETVCPCLNLTVGDIRAAIENGAKDFAAVEEATGVASVCGACRDYAEEVVNSIINGK
ncbi:MAG: (2Fe-2S)-binding protein [Oscillospiraceae bacterium]|nr:(2Fe-2S)-binding protein [Oscillospiraceae bacterium]